MGASDSQNWGALTHWGRVTHICVGKLTTIGSDNGLSPGRRRAIFWTNAGILLIGPLGTNFSEILSEIHAFSFKKMHLKVSSAKWRLFCLGPNELRMIGSCNYSSVKSYRHVSHDIQLICPVRLKCSRNPDMAKGDFSFRWVLILYSSMAFEPCKLFFRQIHVLIDLCRLRNMSWNEV